MQKLNLKIIISVLWITNIITNLCQIVFGFMSAQMLNDIIYNNSLAGHQLNDATILTFTITSLIPIIMAYLVFMIKNDKLNKWLNFSMAIIMGFLSWFDFIVVWFDGRLGPHWLIAFWTSIPLTLAVYYSWKLDKVSD